MAYLRSRSLRLRFEFGECASEQHEDRFAPCNQNGRPSLVAWPRSAEGMPIPPSGARRTGPHGFVFAHVRWIAQSRDGWSITTGREWRQCKHVRYPALAEADDLRLDLGLSVEQRKRAGLSRTIDYYRPFRRMRRRPTIAVDWLHGTLPRPLIRGWAIATRDPATDTLTEDGLVTLVLMPIK